MGFHNVALLAMGWKHAKSAYHWDLRDILVQGLVGSLSDFPALLLRLTLLIILDTLEFKHIMKIDSPPPLVEFNLAP